MSENIQSIANGSFVLGNTSATTYQAGPGISITQPSEGTVRISNDETVLFSAATNDDTIVFNNAITLSESYKSFERIGIYNGHDCYGTIETKSLSGNQDARIWVYYYPTNTASNIEIGMLRYSATDDTHIKAYNNTIVAVTTGGAVSRITNTSNFSTRTKAVIGINRISGGNA